MKRLTLPKEETGYVPMGIYGYPQAERKEAFLKMFSSIEEEPVINEKRMENLKELRGEYR